MTRLLLISCLLFGACKKKEEAKPSEPATAEKKVDETTPATPPEAPAGQPAKPAVAIANAAEYDAKATDTTEKILAIFKAGGKDCDKLAADLTKFAEEYGPTLEGIKAFEDANPEAEKAFEEKMKPREKEFEAIGPTFEACKDHAGLAAAIQKMPI